MAFMLAESWDSVTPPNLPAGWNTSGGGGFVTGTTPYFSSPNSLSFYGGSSGVNSYITNSASDPGGGMVLSITALVQFVSSGGSTANRVGPTFHCSASTMDNSSTSCYWVCLEHTSAGADFLRFMTVVNGTSTTLISIGINDTISTGWFMISIVSAGSNVFNVSVIRMSDGYYLNPTSGQFQSGSVAAISSYTASGIASGPYYGLACSPSSGTSDMAMDDFLVNASGTVPTFPRKPVVVPLPFQYYPPWID